MTRAGATSQVAAILSGAGGGPPPSYTTGAVSFDGATTLDSTTFIVSDSPVGVMSLWTFPTVSGQYSYYSATHSGGYWTIRLGTDAGPGDIINCDFWDGATNTKEFQFHATSPTLALNTWNNIIISVDTNHAAGAKVGVIVLNGTSISVTVVNDADTAFDIGWGVSGETMEPVSFPLGYGADFWVASGQYLDITTAPNIAKFISGGKPVDLGADGSTPTGTAPPIFLRRAPSAAASTFATNLGTGGTFSIGSGTTTTGALIDTMADVVVADVTGITAGAFITATGVTAGTTVLSVDSGTSTVTMSAAATATNPTASMQFGGILRNAPSSPSD